MTLNYLGISRNKKASDYSEAFSRTRLFAVETGFEVPGEASGADEVGIDEEDALESGEDEGDGAPTDAVFGLEEGADDELMTGEHGGEDEPGGPAGVWPGGLGAPEEIGEG